MPLFSLEEGKLEKINKINFKLEKDIQKLTEDNLNEIFGLEFVRTEFQLNNLPLEQTYKYLMKFLNRETVISPQYSKTARNWIGKTCIDKTCAKLLIEKYWTE